MARNENAKTKLQISAFHDYVYLLASFGRSRKCVYINYYQQRLVQDLQKQILQFQTLLLSLKHDQPNYELL